MISVSTVSATMEHFDLSSYLTFARNPHHERSQPSLYRSVNCGIELRNIIRLRPSVTTPPSYRLRPHRTSETDSQVQTRKRPGMGSLPRLLRPGRKGSDACKRKVVEVKDRVTMARAREKGAWGKRRIYYTWRQLYFITQHQADVTVWVLALYRNTQCICQPLGQLFLSFFSSDQLRSFFLAPFADFFPSLTPPCSCPNKEIVFAQTNVIITQPRNS